MYSREYCSLCFLFPFVFSFISYFNKTTSILLAFELINVYVYFVVSVYIVVVGAVVVFCIRRFVFLLLRLLLLLLLLQLKTTQKQQIRIRTKIVKHAKGSPPASPAPRTHTFSNTNSIWHYMTWLGIIGNGNKHEVRARDDDVVLGVWHDWSGLRSGVGVGEEFFMKIFLFLHSFFCGCGLFISLIVYISLVNIFSDSREREREHNSALDNRNRKRQHTTQ
jgi:hypothetical protein